MKTVLIISAFILSIAAAFSQQSRYETIVLYPTNSTSASVSIGANETAEVVTWPPFSTARLTVVKNGETFPFGIINGPDVVTAHVTVTGPASFYLTSGGGQKDFCTLKISPSTFDPNKTLIIPEGTRAIVSLECSTNLTTWTNIWTGTYSNLPTHKFFRLTAERAP